MRQLYGIYRMCAMHKKEHICVKGRRNVDLRMQVNRDRSRVHTWHCVKLNTRWRALAVKSITSFCLVAKSKIFGIADWWIPKYLPTFSYWMNLKCVGPWFHSRVFIGWLTGQGCSESPHTASVLQCMTSDVHKCVFVFARIVGSEVDIFCCVLKNGLFVSYGCLTTILQL